MQKNQTFSKIIDFYNLSHGSDNGYPKINPFYIMQIEIFQLLSLLKIQLSYLELQKEFWEEMCLAKLNTTSYDAKRNKNATFGKRLQKTKALKTKIPMIAAN
jgi:hypothetical protein